MDAFSLFSCAFSVVLLVNESLCLLHQYMIDPKFQEFWLYYPQQHWSLASEEIFRNGMVHRDVFGLIFFAFCILEKLIPFLRLSFQIQKNCNFLTLFA